MKKILSIALMFLFLLPYLVMPVPVHAADETVSYLIPGKVEWWYDKTLKTHRMDVVQDGLTNRINIGMPPFPTIDAEFPSALVSGIADVSKYEVVGVTVADVSEKNDLVYSGNVEIDKVFQYKLPGVTLTNADAIIGKSGTSVSFNSNFQVPEYTSGSKTIYPFQAANGVQMYRVFVPIKVTFKVIPLKTSALATVSGVVDPNPSELTPDGYAYPDLTVTAMATGVPDGWQPTYWLLKYRPETSDEWVSEYVQGGRLSASKLWKIKIKQDTKIYLHAEVHFEDGTTMTATGTL